MMDYKYGPEWIETMTSLNDQIDTLQDLKFELEKARFNHEPTKEIETQYQDQMDLVITTMVDDLTKVLPERLPPLEIGNPKPSLEIPNTSRYQEAIEQIGVADEEDDDLLIQLDGTQTSHHPLLNLVGVWYVYQMEPDQSTGYFQEVLTHTSDDLVLYNLSYALAVQKVLSPALEYLDRISSDFEQARVGLNKAVIYHRLGRYEEATTHFQQAVENDPSPERILYNWAVSSLEFGKIKEAELILEQLQKLDSSYPGISHQLGEIAARKGEYAQAIRSFEEAHRQDPDNLEILSDLATACLIAERYDEAIDYYTSYLDRESSIDVLNNLGAAYLKKDQYQLAVDTFAQAVEIDPNHRSSQKNLKVAKSYLSS